jgi:hydroxymethylglutaryl-CoA lyase
MERALDAGVDTVNALLSVSETYGEKNQGASREESIVELRRIVDLAAGTDVTVEAGISTCFYCPYEGRIPVSETVETVTAAVDAGVDEVTLAATMGLADPMQVSRTLTAVRERWPDLDCGLHLHDTNGMALTNAFVGLQHGIDRFDASLCGVGGGVVLPDALDDVGNVPTEDLLHLLSRTGLCSSERFEPVADLAGEIAGELDVGQNSHVVRGGTAEAVLDVMNADR